MRREGRQLAVYKGDELIATGTVAELAAHFKTSEESVLYWTTAANARRDRGLRKIAVYVDEVNLAQKQYEKFMAMCEWHLRTGLTITPLSLLRELRARDMSATNIRKLLIIFAKKGLLARADGVEARYSLTTKAREYYEECLEQEVTV